MSEPELKIPLPVERLLLPGPRWVWWLITAFAVLVPVTTHLLLTDDREEQKPQTLAAELRGRTFIWRVMGTVTPLRKGHAVQLANVPTSSTDESVEKKLQEAENRDWSELESQARELDLLNHSEKLKTSQTLAREEVMLHALALGEPERALHLARSLTPTLGELPSADMRALLTGLPEAPTELVLNPLEAKNTLNDLHFGRHPGQDWSAYQRDHARVAALERLGDLPAVRKLVKTLDNQDRWVIPAWSTVAFLLMVALLTGAAFWLTALFRAVLPTMASPAKPASDALRVGRGVADASVGETGWQWLLGRYPGLPRDLPYPTDLLLPWLGFGAWLTGCLLASLVLSLAGGQRPLSGLGVLFGAGIGVMLSIAIVQAFARQAPGLLHAARLPLHDPRPNEPTPPALFPSLLAAIRVLTALLPIMLGVVLLTELTGNESPMHPVAGMVLADTDPLQLIAIGLAVTLLAPLGEELIFRGFLYRILRMHWGILPALALTSLAFALLHPALVPYLALSTAFCLAYEWTGSLWTSILLHAGWNGLSYVLLVGFALS